MSVSICYESTRNSVSILYTQCSWLVLLFSVVSVSLFHKSHKFFLIQKSKSTTNLNRKEGKQEKATIGYSTTIFDSWGKYISCLIYPWDNVPGGSFPLGNYVGDKSYKRQFSLRAISRGILSRGNYLWGNFPEAIIQGEIIRWANVRGVIFLRGNCPDTTIYISKLSN